jgi:hypothetical protein
MKRPQSIAISISLAIITLVIVFLVKPIFRNVSAQPTTTRSQAVDDVAAGMSLGIPEAEAQTCTATAYDECGCVCIGGYFYNSCATYGQCPYVGCILGSACLCCAKEGDTK